MSPVKTQPLSPPHPSLHTHTVQLLITSLHSDITTITLSSQPASARKPCSKPCPILEAMRVPAPHPIPPNSNSIPRILSLKCQRPDHTRPGLPSTLAALAGGTVLRRQCFFLLGRPGASAVGAVSSTLLTGVSGGGGAGCRGEGVRCQTRPAEGAQGATVLAAVKGAGPAGPGQSSGERKAKREVAVALGWRMRRETQAPLHSSPAG